MTSDATIAERRLRYGKGNELIKWLVAFVAILVVTALLSIVCAGQANDRTRFDAMLQREIDNRDVARRVVTALAEHHQQSPQGTFWASYAAFERHQAPFYSQLSKRHRLAPRNWKTTVKAAGLTAANKLFPNWSIAILADATRRYVGEMKRTSVPTDREDQVALRYMIAQEQVQEDALQRASRGEFASGAALLREFTASVETRWTQRNKARDAGPR